MTAVEERTARPHRSLFATILSAHARRALPSRCAGHALSTAALWLTLATVGAPGISGCIGVSQKKMTPGIVGGRATDLRVCRAGTRPAEDGNLDDFEDDNNQVTLEGGRDGYWWTKKDEKGSTVEPDPFAPSEGGADGSEMSLRGFGKTSAAPDAWGAGFGVNLVSNQGAFYDASRYVGISFKAKVGAGSTTTVRFKIGDVNTHQDAHVCRACWNHFGKDITLTNQWKEYKVLFTEARQEPYWGDPRPAAVTPSKLVSIDWSIGTGQSFDIWVDDIRFLECQ